MTRCVSYDAAREQRSVAARIAIYDTVNGRVRLTAPTRSAIKVSVVLPA